nr:alpha-N-acetylglucosaminidase-like [Ipomoea trifida]
MAIQIYPLPSACQFACPSQFIEVVIDVRVRKKTQKWCRAEVHETTDSSTLGVRYVSRLLEIHDRERAPASLQLSAAYTVLNRLIPSHSSSFQFLIIAKEQCDGDACFRINNHPSQNNTGSSEILWGGPLPQSWLDQQLVMQKKILARMYELGMTPVLPAFSGNVPAALTQVFPSAKITHLDNWFTVHGDSRWCCTYLLDATDPLFVEIGKAFVREQLKEYGRSSHIYNCDTFDENTPPTDDPEYISSLGAAIFKGMQSGDDNAVWLMQALLHSVPLGRLVVLDLYAEVIPIWCMLHNFAGNIEMYGVLDAVGSGPVEARTSSNSTMVGVGMSMEGIEQNPIVYDLMSEMAFQHDTVDVKAWVDLYSRRRYGKFVQSMQDSWNILYHTIYNCTDGANDKNRDVIVAFPDVAPHSISVLSRLLTKTQKHYDAHPSMRSILEDASDSYDHPHLWYSTSEVIPALKLFISSGDELSNSDTYRYDLVDLTRQVLAKYANQLFLDVIEAYKFGDLGAVATLSQKFLTLVEDMDTLLACHNGFLLGPYLQSAKELTQDEDQKIQYEWNARTLITMWFDNTEDEASLLRDYGNKYWSGLLRDYYGPRAAIYFKYLTESLEKGEGFRLRDWRREWIKLTNDWQSSRKVFPVKSTGDALKTSKRLYEKYLLDGEPFYPLTGKGK